MMMFLITSFSSCINDNNEGDFYDDNYEEGYYDGYHDAESDIKQIEDKNKSVGS